MCDAHDVLGGCCAGACEPACGVLACSVGLRVMKTQDGERVGLEHRDPTFLAEVAIQPKEQLDRQRLGPLEPSTLDSLQGPYINDVPITIYSEAVDKEQYPGSGPTAGTKVKGANPFGKTCNFTKVMTDYSKVIIDE